MDLDDTQEIELIRVRFDADCPDESRAVAYSLAMLAGVVGGALAYFVAEGLGVL